ncbi:MAG: Lpg1974 family pore-forming outer membrane protein [Chlamydiota bacterium]
MKILQLPSSALAIFVLFATLLSAEDSSKPLETSNGLPNISARFHPNTTSFDIFAAPLFWTAEEIGTDCWAEVLDASTAPTYDDIQSLHFRWNLGFRVGLGYGMQHDSWDTQTSYTSFQTHGKDHLSLGNGMVHSAFLANFYVANTSGQGFSGPSYESASIHWSIGFHMLDWELGRNFLVSKALALRPFVGLKGGWIHQSIHTKWIHPDLPEAELFDMGWENLKNNFWGIGPEGGINTKWILLNRQNHLFSLFGNLSGAIMWGHWSFSDVFKNDIHQQIIIGSQSFNSAAWMFRIFTGLQWEASLQQNRYQFTTKLGYEMQFWLNQLQFYSFTGGRQDNLLTLQGGSLEFCFDF